MFKQSIKDLEDKILKHEKINNALKSDLNSCNDEIIEMKSDNVTLIKQIEDLNKIIETVEAKDKSIQELQLKLTNENKINETLRLKFEREVNNNQIATQQYEDMKKLLTEENSKLKNMKMN